MAKLNPPYIEGKLPAQVGDTLKIPFEHSQTKPANLSGIKLRAKIKTVNTNKQITTVDSKDANAAEFAFDPTENSNPLTIGQFYKIQLCYLDGDEEGYYSTVGIFKYTSVPETSLVVSGAKLVDIDAITIDDISSDIHTLDIGVSRKNLFNIHRIENQSYNNNQFTLINGGDYLTISVPKIGNYVFTKETLHQIAPEIQAGETYTLSANTSEGAWDYIYIDIADQRQWVWQFGTSRMITQEMLDARLGFYTAPTGGDASITTAIISNIQIEKGNIATAYTSYIEDLSSSAVTIPGKNLFGGDALADSIVAIGGTKDADNGTIIFNSHLVRSHRLFKQFKENTQYTFIVCGRNTVSGKTVTNLAVWYTEPVDGNNYCQMIFPSSNDSNNKKVIYKSLKGKTIQAFGTIYSDGTTLLEYNECGIFEGDIGEQQFERYIGTNYIPNEQGKIVGAKSKPISPLNVFARGMNLSVNYIPNYNTQLTAYLNYSSDDSTELLSSIKYTLYANNTVVATSDWLSSGTKYVFAPWRDTTYILKCEYKTLNGYIGEILQTISAVENPSQIDITALRNQDDGYIDITRGNNLWRKAEGENWKFLTSTSNNAARDFSIEQGITYQYSDGKYLSNKIYADFEDSFLTDKNGRQLKIRFNPKVSSFKTTILETKTDTIGAKYPFFFRNGNVSYKEIPISGLISLLMDDNHLFIEASAQASLTRPGTNTPENSVIADLPHNLSSSNIRNEREFKLAVLDWLNNGEPKLFRSPTEGNYVVRLMNVTLQPNDTLGRMLHTFSATGYEVEEDKGGFVYELPEAVSQITE